MNTIEFEGKTIIVDGKGDEQFVNDRIRELREKRNTLQDKIFELSKQLNQLEEERNNTQEEIDNEFLRQEHAYDLVGKYIKYGSEIYFVTSVERLFDGVRPLSNWYCDTKHKLCYTSAMPANMHMISFEVLAAILSGNDKNNKFISKEEALKIFNQIIEKNNKIYEK